MKYYHFTAKHLLNRIRREGLTLGQVLISVDPIKLIPGYQHLTTNKDFNQSWQDQRYSSLPYNRNDVRLTIKIPFKHCRNVLNWLDFSKNFPTSEILNSHGDPYNWRVYRGSIPKEWISKVEWNKTIAR
jgi:hypothetical protein